MKPLLLIAILILPELVYCQSTDNIDYGKRAQGKAIAGGILLVGGIAAGISGASSAANEVAAGMFTGTEPSGAGPTIMVVGLVSSVVGIGLLVSAGKDRKKAASVSAGYMSYPPTPYSTTSFKSVPSLTLRIRF